MDAQNEIFILKRLKSLYMYYAGRIRERRRKEKGRLWINKKSSTDNGLRLVQYHSVDQQLIKRTEATKQNQIGKNKNPKIFIYVINYKLHN